MSTLDAARTEPLRFAHPFFTTTSPAQRGARLLDYIQGTLQPIPAPRGDSTMTLADIIGTAGATGIERSGRLRPGPAQAEWLVQTLTRIQQQRSQGTRKALIMATHHPPFTAGGHSPSTEMLAEIDAACQQAQIMPDLFLSGHAHSYQRYTRRVPFNGQTLEIPYLVVGIGGINDQAVPPAHGQVTGDHTFVSSRQGYGYLLIEVTATAITGTMTAVSGTQRTPIEQFSVSLASNRVS